MSTFIISAILVVVIALIIFVLARDKKSGKGMCGGSCANCSAACQYKQNKDDKNGQNND